MDLFSRHRLTLWIVVILILLNVFTLVLFWYREHRTRGLMSPGFPVHNPPRMELFLKKELSLTEEQVDQIQILRRQYFTTILPLKKKSHELHGRILEESLMPEPDDLKVREWAEAIGQNEVEIVRHQYDHMKRLKNLARPEQMDRLRRFIREIHHRMEPGRRRPWRPVQPYSPPPGDKESPAPRPLKGFD